MRPAPKWATSRDAEKGIQLRSQSFGRLNVLTLYASASELLAASLAAFLSIPALAATPLYLLPRTSDLGPRASDRLGGAGSSHPSSRAFEFRLIAGKEFIQCDPIFGEPLGFCRRDGNLFVMLHGIQEVQHRKERLDGAEQFSGLECLQ
jgi:hypothetical protein